MPHTIPFHAIIVGGSYAGLSAALALGRAMRRVLVIDSGQPCNRFAPHSHNFLTQDGRPPSEIAATAMEQVAQYDTVSFHQGLVAQGEATEDGFIVTTDAEERFACRKLLFATGLNDLLPEIPGFAACWGTSVMHCPYCHGYEVRHAPTGILANGDIAYHYAQLISNWTTDLRIFTNGPAAFTPEQSQRIASHGIPVIEQPIDHLAHAQGRLSAVVCHDGSSVAVEALYARPEVEQHCSLPMELGCTLTEQGLLEVDMLQRTTVAGVYACGDSASPLRAVSHAVATGGVAAAAMNHDMVTEDF